MAPPVVRTWPKVSKYHPANVTAAFQFPVSRTRAFLGSPGVTAAFGALAVWKTKYAARASPAVTKIVAKNAAAPGRRPSGELQEYLALLETMVAASRPFFGLRPTDPVGFAAMRDAHRVLCCGPAAAAAYARSTSTRTKTQTQTETETKTQTQTQTQTESPPAPAPTPRQPGIAKRIDLLTSWENPPAATARTSCDDATRYASSIQRRLARWGDFEAWLAAQYRLPRGAGPRCLAYTTPSCGPLARFDLKGLRLTEACWDRAVSAASRTGLLMVVFRTGERGWGGCRGRCRCRW